MKIVVISDIHSNLAALEAVARKLPKYDELYCLGDVTGYGPQPNEVIETLQRLEPTVVLMGNHDYAVITGDVNEFSSNAAKAVKWTRRELGEAGRAYLSKLGSSARIERSGVTLGLYHGSPRDPLAEYILPGIPESLGRALVRLASTRVVLLGHTHIPMLYCYDGEVLANPGSVGQPRDGDPRASFALLTLSKTEVNFDVQRVEYDVDTVADNILRSGLPSFLAERLYIGA